MSHKKQYIVHIWFLDDDLVKSAQMLTNKCLMSSIKGCVGAIISTYMYLVGIRSKKFYSYYFSKENATDTLQTKFIGWPLKSNPKFNAYMWKETKWCRACHENYDYLVAYLEALCDEYSYRYSHMHESFAILDWAMSNDVIASFPYAKIDSITLPWKSIDPQFRSIDIIDGYRKQYCATQIDDSDPFLAYSKCRRDIPDFVVDEFDLRHAFEK